MISPIYKLKTAVGGIHRRKGGGIPIQSEYLTVKAAMTTPPSSADAVIQNRLIYDLKEAGVWDKAIILDNFSCHDEQSSLLNWKSPGTFNPTKYLSPNYAQYLGFGGAGTAGVIKLNFIPSSDGAGFLGQDDITIIQAIQTDISEALYDLGGTSVDPTKAIAMQSRSTDHTIYGTINSALNYSGIRCILSKRYFALGRNSATIHEVYKNSVKTTQNVSSTGLCVTSLQSAGVTNNHSHKTISFSLIFKYLTTDEIHLVLKACDDYLDNYNNKIRPYQTNVDFNLALEGHSFINSTLHMEDAMIAKVNVKKYFNSSVGGSIVSNLVTRQATLDSKLIAETATYKNILLLWIGVNEITNTAGTGTTCYNAMKSYIQSRITAGWKVFCYTCTPTTISRDARFEAERVIFNNLIRNDLSLLNNVYIMDTDTISEFNNPADTTYFNADALHLTPANPIPSAWLASALFSNKMELLYG